VKSKTCFYWVLLTQELLTFKQFDSFINIIYLIKSDTAGLGRIKDGQRNRKGRLQKTQ